MLPAVIQQKATWLQLFCRRNCLTDDKLIWVLELFMSVKDIRVLILKWLFNCFYILYWRNTRKIPWFGTSKNIIYLPFNLQHAFWFFNILILCQWICKLPNVTAFSACHSITFSREKLWYKSSDCPCHIIQIILHWLLYKIFTYIGLMLGTHQKYF